MTIDKTRMLMTDVERAKRLIWMSEQ
jgi:hypothetical protein